MVFNKEVAKTYLKYTWDLKKDFKLKGDLSLAELIQLPGVVDARETIVSADSLWPVIEKCFSYSEVKVGTVVTET